MMSIINIQSGKDISQNEILNQSIFKSIGNLSWWNILSNFPTSNCINNFICCGTLCLCPSSSSICLCSCIDCICSTIVCLIWYISTLINWLYLSQCINCSSNSWGNWYLIEIITNGHCGSIWIGVYLFTLNIPC